MGGLTFVLLATWRSRWRSWLSLCLLVALASGLVLAGAGAGDRAATSFSDFEKAHGYDAFFYGAKALPEVARLPEVTSVVTLRNPATGLPRCLCHGQFTANDDFNLGEARPGQLSRLVKLVAGRMPSPHHPDEVLASFTLERDFGVHIGSIIHMPFFSAAQAKAVLSSDGAVRPRGPTIALRVVGTSAAEIEFPASKSTTYSLYATDALGRLLGHRTVNFWEYFVRLRHGTASLASFEPAARRLGALSVSNVDAIGQVVNASIHPQAVGWWALALLSGLVGLAVVAQALRREAVLGSEPYATLSALGASRNQLAGLALARTAVIAVVGSALGMLVAFLLSPLAPVGEARLAEPAPGFSFSAGLFLLGAVGAAAIVFSVGSWPAVRTATLRPGRWAQRVAVPSRAVSVLTQCSAPPTALIGVGQALERARGPRAAPVTTALVGTALAVTVLCGTAIFSTSLSHLTSTPALYGQPFGAVYGVNQTGTVAQNEAVLAGFERDKSLSAITIGIGAEVEVNGTTVAGVAGRSLRGPLLFTPVQGRLPSAPGQVDLGTSTLRHLGGRIGSLVQVAFPGQSRSRPYRVVGTGVFPSDFTTGGLGTGAMFSLSAVLGQACPRGPGQVPCQVRAVIGSGGAYLLQARPGPAGANTLARYDRIFAGALSVPGPPTSLVNFGVAVNFPLIFGAVVVVFGAATLLHVLVLSTSRRRRDVALLKALGFVRAQVLSSVLWQATTVAVVGLAIGLPVGIALGRVVWAAFAANLGVLPVTAVRPWAIVAVALAVPLGANLLALGPAWASSRARPAPLLRRGDH